MAENRSAHSSSAWSASRPRRRHRPRWSRSRRSRRANCPPACRPGSRHRPCLRPSPTRARSWPGRRKPASSTSRSSRRRPSRARTGRADPRGAGAAPQLVPAADLGAEALVGPADRRHHLALHQEEARRGDARRARGHPDPGRFRPRDRRAITERAAPRPLRSRRVGRGRARHHGAPRSRRSWRRWRRPLDIDRRKKPFVILFIGVNGSGKTTTIGKLAANFRADGQDGDARRRRHVPRRRDRAAADLGPAHRRRRSIARPAGSDAAGPRLRRRDARPRPRASTC